MPLQYGRENNLLERKDWMITVTRSSTESKIKVTLEKGPIRPDYRKAINTPMPFLSHMIEHIVWRSGINIGVDVALDQFALTHVVAEDVGMTIGKALCAYLEQSKAQGTSGYGDGVGIIDEARALAAVSFESRSMFVFDSNVKIPDMTEGTLSEDLSTFIGALAQGANCTIHLSVERGENGHHIWEAAYRALGIALGRALSPDQSRIGMTSGVAGSITYEVEAKNG